MCAQRVLLSACCRGTPHPPARAMYGGSFQIGGLQLAKPARSAASNVARLRVIYAHELFEAEHDGDLVGSVETEEMNRIAARASRASLRAVGAEMVGMFLRLWHDKAGSALIEYSILVAIMIAVIIAGVVAAGSWASGMWVHLLNILG